MNIQIQETLVTISGLEKKETSSHPALKILRTQTKFRQFQEKYAKSQICIHQNYVRLLRKHPKSQEIAKKNTTFQNMRVNNCQ